MSGEPSHDQIMEAINDSGYLMEQEVATKLEGLGYHVSTNYPYLDIEEGKSREVDVRAIKRVGHNLEQKISAFGEIVVECKNNSNPYVFIGRKKTKSDRAFVPQEYRFPISRYEARGVQNQWGGFPIQSTPAFQHLGFDKVHYASQSEMKAVQFCRIDRKGSAWSANHGGLYDAIFYPMAKAVSSRYATLQEAGRGADWKYIWIFVPLVVVSGPIYYVDSMNQLPVPEPRSYVTFRRQLISEKLKGVFSIDFVRQDYLTQFDAENLVPIADLANELVIQNASLLLQKEIAWDHTRTD